MTSGGDPIETLLKATGRRPAVPQERAERLRAAAHGAWQAEVGRRRLRRRIAGAGWLAAAVVLAILAVWTFQSTAPPVLALTVDKIAGSAWVERGNARDLLTSGTALTAGSTLVTAANARVALKDEAGRSVRLDQATAIGLTAEASFVLRQGAIYVDSGGAPPGTRIETAFGTIDDVGTQFEARVADDALRIRVREGKVKLHGRTRAVTAGAGEAIVARVDRVAHAVDPDAASGWEWIEGAMTMMSIDGRPLSEFLTWAARERGSRVKYADPNLAQKAPAIVLRGSIEGMSLDQAVASVIATSGLTYRWGAGELVVGETP
jgi:hypothetical protein